MTIGEQIKLLRKEMGFSQSEFAELIGLTRYQTLQKIESGVREPSSPLLKKIAESLECDLVPPQLVRKENKKGMK